MYACECVCVRACVYVFGEKEKQTGRQREVDRHEKKGRDSERHRQTDMRGRRGGGGGTHGHGVLEQAGESDGTVVLSPHADTAQHKRQSTSAI